MIKAPVPGLLARLCHDARGNTLAIMAAMLIPLAGFSGSAIDMGRLYAVKSRLQQACDAGVLAGEKDYVLKGTLDTSSTGPAQTFFNNNFHQGWFQTASVSFVPSTVIDSQSITQVYATASATVPMTIMKMFGIAPQTVQVSCQARDDVADTDIVFVLDTTGSMACLPADSDTDCGNYVVSEIQNSAIVKYTRPMDSELGASSGSVNDSVAGYPGSIGFYVPEKTGSRIAALRTAVVNFYTTLANSADSSTHIRYGFVTYSSTVNTGKAVMEMSPSYMVGGSGNTLKTWTYQSRTPTNDYVVSSTATTKTTSSQSDCSTNNVARNPATLYTYNSSSQATETKTSYNSSNSKCTITAYTYGPVWSYQPVSYDVSKFLASTSVDDPSDFDGSVAQWQGCVEERSTTPGISSFDITKLPPDLDPDLIPDVSDSKGSSSWRPMMPEVIYGRNGFQSTATTTSNGDTSNTNVALSYWNYGSYYLLRAGAVVCGKPIRRVATMSQTDVTNYVNASDFRAIGGTYHDAGMVWGVRLLSRNGIFAADNGTWPNHQPPNRVIVFLTDGDMEPTLTAYGQYGIEYYDQRVTGGDYNSQKGYHNARFLAECAKAKAMNISVWTVSIAPTPAAGSPTPVQQCASTTQQALFTQSGSDLASKFVAIAQQVAMLRLAK